LHNKNIAVFFDRDGTINEEIDFVKNPDELRLIENAAKAIRKINSLGLKSIIVSNQSGIARGFFTETELKIINDRLVELLKKENAFLEHIYYCPHHPEGTVKEYSKNCDCRKPKTGLIEKAEKDYNLDLINSFMIGDMLRDLECGLNAGLKTILVRTGKGEETLRILPRYNYNIDYIAKDLIDAVNFIEKKITIKQ
jgi:D-glycero-D-manno-heptose 1,7-bisphosphate phosphatase